MPGKGLQSYILLYYILHFSQVQSEEVQHEESSNDATACINEEDMKELVKLDIIQAVMSMGFPLKYIKCALLQKLTQTASPFFKLESCIEAVLQCIEEETRRQITNGSRPNEGNVTEEMDIEEIEINTTSQKDDKKPSTEAQENSSEIQCAEAESEKSSIAELEKLRDTMMCKISMDRNINIIFLPCKHMMTCESCAVAMQLCPYCRDPIKFYIKPILS